MIWTKEKVFELICQSKRARTLGLFVGSGFSKAVTNGDMPSWKDLLEKVSSMMGVDKSTFEEGATYPVLASGICKKYVDLYIDQLREEDSSSEENRDDVDYNPTYLIEKAERLFKYKVAEAVNISLKEEQEDKYSKILTSLSPNWVVTTNYDFIVEKLLGDKALSINPRDSYIKTGDFIPIYHIHGSIADPSSIVITNEDYAQTLRVSDYRHARLPFLIKESTVLMMGYSLNDLNVLSAVDYSKNVYTNTQPYYDTPIIQLVYCETPRSAPYVSDQGIVIVEISDLFLFLEELVEFDLKYNRKANRTQQSVKKLNKIFIDNDTGALENFINNIDMRKELIREINALKCENWFIYSSFVSFINNCLGLLWVRASAPRAFSFYRDILSIVLDLIENTNYKNVPIAFVDSLVNWFCDIAPYIGFELGQSFDAKSLFDSRCKNIPEDFIIEFERRPYYGYKHRCASNLLQSIPRDKETE